MSAIFIDHYAALEIPRTAAGEDVRRAFRRLARVHHPDRGGEALRFHEIYTAYRLLSNEDDRARFDRQLVLRHVRSIMGQRKFIHPSRIVVPTTMAALAKRGLLRKQFRGRDRRMHLRVDYDLELPLGDDELKLPLLVPVPVTLRNICPECRGGDTHCPVCNGRGSYKSGGMFRLNIDGGLVTGQIIEIRLQGMRPAPLQYYKKSTIRIKVTRAA